MKERLDVIVARREPAMSREQAKRSIESGLVYVDGKKILKAGAFFEKEEADIEVRGCGQQYVGRGGLKLQKALETWQIGFQGCVCLDIGASTGGFTDCMLQHGAARVYAVDVGRGQLAEELRRDPRVVSMEQTNFRLMSEKALPEEPDFVSADVSFISLTKILIPAARLLREGGGMVCLVKPQFEAGKGKVSRKGVVREPQIHREVLEKVITYADLAGFAVEGFTYSPIRGGEGNLEYLLYLSKNGEPGAELSEEAAEAELGRLLAQKAGPAYGPGWKERIAAVVEAARKL